MIGLGISFRIIRSLFFYDIWWETEGKDKNADFSHTNDWLNRVVLNYG